MDHTDPNRAAARSPCASARSRSGKRHVNAEPTVDTTDVTGDSMINDKTNRSDQVDAPIPDQPEPRAVQQQMGAITNPVPKAKAPRPPLFRR
jgi:hypothetical protein